MIEPDIDYLHKMIPRCQLRFTKTMPQCLHEYIVQGKCSLTEKEFLYFVDMQRCFGIYEGWGQIQLSLSSYRGV